MIGRINCCSSPQPEPRPKQQQPLQTTDKAMGIGSLNAICDELCITPSAWPIEMQALHARVRKIVMRYCGRWDLREDWVCLHTIDVWKKAGSNVTDVQIAQLLSLSKKRRK